MRKNRTNNSDWSTMLPVLSQSGPRPVALYRALRHAIEKRQLLPGEKLPPSRILAEQMKVSRGAVVAAYEQLLAEGYAESQRGSGTFVASLVPKTPAPRKLLPGEMPAKPLIGEWGSAMPDEKTLRVLRQLYRQVLNRPPASLFHYGDIQGNFELRTAIADYLRQVRGMLVEPQSIFITGGTKAGQDLIIRSCLNAGDKVWMEDPCYFSAKAAMEVARLQIVPVPVDGDGLIPEKGIARASDAKAIYLTPSHQFPLGITLTMPRRLALLAWAKKAGAWIIEDDYDSEFRFTGPPLASLHGIDSTDRVIYLGTFSKALAPGLRIGYAVVPRRLVGQVRAMREHVGRPPEAITEAVIARYLREGHHAAHIKRMRKRVQRARDMLAVALSHGPFDVQKPDQGLHLVGFLLNNHHDETRAVSLMREAGLGVRALSSMYMTESKRYGIVVGFSDSAPERLAEIAENAVSRVNAHL